MAKNKYSMASFDGLGVFSIRENEPAKASRPFDKNREGMNVAEGFGILFLQDKKQDIIMTEAICK